MSVAQIRDCACAFEEPQTGKLYGPFLCVGAFLNFNFCFIFQAALIRTPKSRNNLPAKFECDICQKKFRFGSNLKSHQAIHEQQRLFECSLCQNNLLVTALRSGHLVTKTTLLDRSESMEHKAVTSNDCCHGYHHPGDLKEHIQSKVRRFMCDKCARTFRSESNLSIHMKTHTIDKIKDILKATLSRFAAE